MPFPGGDADKVGNRYEALWTVHCLLQILKGEAKSITLEILGKEWHGVEFKFETNDFTEYHQVKRQNRSEGHWTIADLAGKNVLDTAKSILANKSDCFVFKFVSEDSVSSVRELNDRALSSHDYDEFKINIEPEKNKPIEVDINTKPKNHKESFKKIVTYWNESEEQSYDYLRRFYCEAIDEKQLNNLIEALAGTVIHGNVKSIIASLRHFCEINLHQNLTISSIWLHLRNAGFSPIAWGQDDNVLLNIERCNDRYVQSSINKEVIPRTEIIQSVQSSLNNGCKHIAIVGDAGSGKSVVLQSVFSVCRSQGQVILGFRLDRVNATQLPKELGQQLSLPNSPVYVLAQIANNTPCILFIDQLDAVSLTSGRHPDFFNCIEAIINEARMFPNMQLVFGCRAFDLNHDHRFRQLFEKKHEKQAQQINVTHLATEQVNIALQKAGFEPNKLTLKQQTLLRLPLHLAIFLESFVAEDVAYNFTAVHELYEKLAERKKANIKERTNKTIAWSDILDRLAQSMSENQALSVPWQVLRSVEDDANNLVSAGVIIFENNRYAFFHEGFFDYCFANWFLAQNESIVTFLSKSEQHLFRRAQVRQIFNLLREQDPSRYYRELAQILSDDNIRLHLKSVVLVWLGNIRDPQNEELEIILPIILGNDEAIQNGLWVGLDVLAWLDLFYSSGWLKKWMESTEQRWLNLAQGILRVVLEKDGDKFASIIFPYCQHSIEWEQWLITILHQRCPQNSKKIFDYFLLLLKEGKLDNARDVVAVNSDFWMLFYSLEKKYPEWACELIGTWLTRQVTLCRLDPKNYKLPDSQFAGEIFEVAKTHSFCFYQYVFPPMLELIELNLAKDESSCRMDRIWSFRIFNYKLSLSSLILSEMESAVCNLAANDKESFNNIFNQLKNCPYETVQFLLVRALKDGGETFADMAIDYLLTDKCKLRLGCSGDNGWASRELINTATRFCTDEKLEKLEAVLLSYYTDYETSVQSYQPTRKCQWSNCFGYSQFTVLSGIDKDRQSLAVKKRLQEWQRKFGKNVPEPPQGITVGAVHSPIKTQAIDRMTNTQWLKAVVHYDANARKNKHDDFLKGDAHQLSGDLEYQTKLNPERFGRLALSFPKDTTHCYYFDAVIRGLTEAKTDLTLLEELCCYCHDLPNKPCGRWLPRLIAKNKEQVLPERLLDIVAWYALHDPDPDNSCSIGNDIAFEAINSVRGAAVGAIYDLVVANKRYVDYFLPFVEQLTCDPSVIVRSEVFLILMAIMNVDYDKSNQLFRVLLESDELLSTTRWVEQYLNYAVWERFDSVKDILEQFLYSENNTLKAIGARQICVASLNNKEAVALAELCLHGDKAMRQAAAEVFSNNVGQDAHRVICIDRLTKLFNDEDKEIQNKAANCFWHIKEEDLTNYLPLINAFISSVAVQNLSYNLINMLENAVNHLPDKVIELIECYMNKKNKKYDPRSYQISELLIRLYAQSKSLSIQTRCLDVIDLMVMDRFEELNSELLLFDR